MTYFSTKHPMVDVENGIRYSIGFFSPHSTGPTWARSQAKGSWRRWGWLNPVATPRCSRYLGRRN
jgi:hypothetical protein